MTQETYFTTEIKGKNEKKQMKSYRKKVVQNEEKFSQQHRNSIEKQVRSTRVGMRFWKKRSFHKSDLISCPATLILCFLKATGFHTFLAQTPNFYNVASKGAGGHDSKLKCVPCSALTTSPLASGMFLFMKRLQNDKNKDRHYVTTEFDRTVV